jgi:hypothetical protein
MARRHVEQDPRQCGAQRLEESPSPARLAGRSRVSMRAHPLTDPSAWRRRRSYTTKSRTKLRARQSAILRPLDPIPRVENATSKGQNVSSPTALGRPCPIVVVDPLNWNALSENVHSCTAPCGSPVGLCERMGGRPENVHRHFETDAEIPLGDPSVAPPLVVPHKPQEERAVWAEPPVEEAGFGALRDGHSSFWMGWRPVINQTRE